MDCLSSFKDVFLRLLAFNSVLSVTSVKLSTGQVLGKIQSMVSSTGDQTVAEKPNPSVHAEQLSTLEMERRMKLLRDDR